MQSKSKRVLVAAAWFASLALANYVGGVIGFLQGFSMSRALQGQEAFVSVKMLQMLRQARLPELTNVLEHQLDSQISSSVTGTAEKTFRSPYNFWGRALLRDALDYQTRALGDVLKYREEHPPVGPDASKNAALMEKLAAYRNAPAPSFVAPQKN